MSKTYSGLVVGLAVGLVITNCYWMWKWREQMRVIRVIDGDTFVIRTGERVRLAGLDAPEIGSCYADESKSVLENMIGGKVIKIEGIKRDSWGRRLGFIWVGKTNINFEMVKIGAARYDNFSDEKSAQMENAGSKAEADKAGLFGVDCEGKKDCVVLGNIDESSGKKYYHVPGCPTYARVKIDKARGEKIFCFESEAEEAGFILAPDCTE